MTVLNMKYNNSFGHIYKEPHACASDCFYYFNNTNDVPMSVSVANSIRGGLVVSFDSFGI